MPAGIGELFLQCWRMRSPFSLAAPGGGDEPMERRSITNPLVARIKRDNLYWLSAKDVYSISLDTR
jgi:hypothetical protein